MRRRLIGTVAAVVTFDGMIVVSAATGVSGAVTPAIDCTQSLSTNGKESDHFTGNGANIRTGPRTSCTSVGEGFKGQSASQAGHVTGRFVITVP